MQFSLFALGALATAATCSPLAMPEAFLTSLESRAANNCTQYCSVSAGCASTTCEYSDHLMLILGTGQSCTGLQAYVPICINTPWYHYTPPVQPAFGTHYTPDQTPVPIMPNIISSCQDFELVAPGTPVEDLATENDFPVEDFAKWNGNSSSPWAAYWSCVKA
ncbi:hypothetical protein M409DRAFT_49342 [Zasmidium cellare ATCC 36951]|uniref:LysM domain-containing protein n=1 Tax=Zasmidium cellare ATCC 36951 TaxID=1080233 RepID=A0A6A6D070_ZASCE|nr:uncharacterized protein M409DRAFT_49342 [Zasmidium cellare ATCC 36951]KAF2172814.1 hypothetical protein M409DRAFT_49342 [Zasmidium cellare ATCC 36951]